MGRSTDNDIVIDCPSVSSHHCEMKRIEGGYILEDKDSTNGIKLDDERMEIIDLENDLDILVGDAALEFELTDKEKDALAEEDHVPKQRAPLPKKKETPFPSQLLGQQKGAMRKRNTSNKRSKNQPKIWQSSHTRGKQNRPHRKQNQSTT